MKIIVRILIVLSFFRGFAQEEKLELYFVLFGEVDMQMCDEPQRVLFQSPMITHQIDNYAERNEYIKEVKQSYKIYVQELVDIEFPQYYLKDCIPEVSKWAFFEEWNMTDSVKFKETIASNYENIKTVDTDFIYYPEKQPAKEVIDPKATLTKAFYDEALKTFNAKDYSKTIDILDKAKENLDGKINLDIIFLEAKARFKNDKNINTSKSLFKTFVNEGAKNNDERIQEAAQKVVQIETSDEFYDNGYRKVVETDLNIGKDVVLNKDFLNQDGSILSSRQYKMSWGNSIYKEIDFTSPKGKRILYFDRNKNVEKEVYYHGDKINTIIYVNQNQIDYCHNGKNTQWVNYKGKSIDLKIYKEYNTQNDNEVYLKLSNCEIIETYPVAFDRISSQNTFEDIGMVKKLKVSYEKDDFDIYTFGENGLPLEKIYFKRPGKIKDTYKFNFETHEWDEI